MGNNEYTSNTRKPSLTSLNATNSRRKYNRTRLQFPQRYAILATSQREETNYGGNDDGKISNRKRNSRNAESIRRYYHQTAAAEETCGLQSRELLEDKRGRLTGVLGQAEEYPRQKIKPARDWQKTIEILAAIRSSARLWKVQANDPWKSLPIFSIALAQKEVKVIQDMGVR